LRTGIAFIAIGTFFSRLFGLGPWSAIDAVITGVGVLSIVMAIKLFVKSYRVERTMVQRLEKELEPEAVEKRVEESIQSHKFSSFE
jgi:hypothetical protein